MPDETIIALAAALTFIVTFVVGPIAKRVHRFFRVLWENWVLLQGRRGVDGIRPRLLPLAERMRQIETEMVTKAEHAEVVSRLKDNRAAIEKVAYSLRANGGDTRQAGDLLMLIAQAVGVEIPEERKDETR